MKIDQTVSEKKTFKDCQIVYMYIAQEQGHSDNPRVHNFCCNKKKKEFASLIIRCKFHPLVFNTFWETKFSIFSPYKKAYRCIFDFAVKMIKCQPRVIISTDLVVLESPMLYIKIEP